MTFKILLCHKDVQNKATYMFQGQLHIKDPFVPELAGIDVQKVLVPPLCYTIGPAPKTEIWTNKFFKKQKKIKNKEIPF